MTIRQLIAHLLQENDIDDEIIVTWWDKNYFVEALDITDTHKVLDNWKEFVKDGQETVNAHLEFTQTGYDLASDFEELLEEKGDN